MHTYLYHTERKGGLSIYNIDGDPNTFPLTKEKKGIKKRKEIIKTKEEQ